MNYLIHLQAEIVVLIRQRFCKVLLVDTASDQPLRQGHSEGETKLTFLVWLDSSRNSNPSLRTP
jgi:hypothetical protein